VHVATVARLIPEPTIRKALAIGATSPYAINAIPPMDINVAASSLARNRKKRRIRTL